MAWYLGLSSVDKYMTYPNTTTQGSEIVLRFVHEKAIKQIKDKVEEGGKDLDNIVNMLSKLIQVLPSQDENWQQLVTSCVESNTDESFEELRNSICGQRLVNSHVEPRLCCLDDQSRFPVLWSEKRIEFFTKVWLSIYFYYKAMP